MDPESPSEDTGDTELVVDGEAFAGKGADAATHGRMTAMHLRMARESEEYREWMRAHVKEAEVIGII